MTAYDRESYIIMAGGDLNTTSWIRSGSEQDWEEHLGVRAQIVWEWINSSALERIPLPPPSPTRTTR